MMQPIFASLLLFLLAAYCNSQQQLSPLIPPAAFAGNYYTCQFRVLGVDFPRYEFQGLPPSMTGSPTGKVSGTPNQIGSYPVTVSFEANAIKTSANFLFRVLRPIWTTFASQITSTTPPLLIYLEQNSTIFMLGDSIYIKAAAVGGKPPYIWTYLRMPITLMGDQNGAIRGILSLDGSYSFGVSCADQQGNSGDLFITLNIQPMTFFGKYTIQPVYVQNRNSPTANDWKSIFSKQQQASKTFKRAFNLTENLKIKYKQLALMLPEFGNAVLIAQAKVQSTSKSINKSLEIQGRATAELARATDELARKNISYQLALSALTKEKESLKAATIQMQRQQMAFDKAHRLLQTAGTDLIEAQTLTAQAVQSFKQKQLKVQTYKLELDHYLNINFQTKKHVENSTIALQISQANLSLAQNDVLAAKRQNDQAASQFILSDTILNQTTEALDQANLHVAKVRADRGNAILELQKANFNLVQLENQLLVAQAAKAEADKLYQKANVLRQTYLQTAFAGCQQLSFPSWSGTGQVEKMLQNGVQLTSGQNVLWGSCTKKSACKRGDIIFFEGFLKGGSVHALSVSTLTLKL